VTRRPLAAVGSRAGRLATSILAVAGVGALARRDASRVATERSLARLADQQAALRRVATLVARGMPPAEVFAAVAQETGQLLNAEVSNIVRYESDDTLTVMAGWSERGGHLPVGRTFQMEGVNLATLVSETLRPARIDNYQDAPGAIAASLGERGIRAGVGCPIVVDGRLWGVVAVLSTGSGTLPKDTEPRLAEFTELVATAISNAQARAELDASRRRIVATADKARRRIERDLHDGIQQRLISLALELRAAEATLPAGSEELRVRLARVAEGFGERAGRAARGLARHPSGNPVAGRPGLGAEGARPPLRCAGGAGPAPGGPAAGAGGGGGLLRGR
jgi:GAF domain-containing protein